MDQTKSAELTPEQLLKILDAQLESARNQRPKLHSGRRLAIVGGGVLVIAAGGIFALMFLQQMLAELSQGARGETPNSDAAPVELIERADAPRHRQQLGGASH